MHFYILKQCFPSLILLALITTLVAGDASGPTKKDSILGRCTRCRFLTDSIHKIIKNFLYEKDELFDKDTFDDVNKFNLVKRKFNFDEVKGKLCLNLKLGKHDCRTLVEEQLGLIEAWWKTDQRDNEDDDNEDRDNVVFDQLCIKTLKFCCPENRYGPECLPCPGHPNQVCSNNGKCAGAGTRKGNGHCLCKPGYHGGRCEQCQKSYFLNQTLYSLNQTVQCLPCDSTCADSCFSPGPSGCHVCKTGYAWENNYGCLDIDECAADYHNECPPNSFCINTEGSYQCYQCDHACDGCDGDGPDSCLKCAQDHILKEGVCVNPNPQPLFTWPASPARYLTYFGLCLVTCILFRHNIILTSIIGLVVALYIMFSERSLNTDYGRKIDQYFQKIFG